MGKRLGEMWHALHEDEREEYRQRAKDQAEYKLREWQEKMKQFPNHAMNSLAQVSSQVKKFERPKQCDKIARLSFNIGQFITM